MRSAPTGAVWVDPGDLERPQGRALDHFGVPEREKQELVDAYVTAMDEVDAAG